MLDKTILIAKVLEISPTEISYSLYNSQDAAAYKISKSEISSINYSNGTKELFNIAKEKIITEKLEEPSYTKQLEKEKTAPSRIEIWKSKKHRLTISTSLFPLLIYEDRININYCYKYRYSFGFSLGHEYPNSLFERNPLANYQELWPGCVYQGTTLRINYKCFLMERRRLSLSAQLLYKELSFRDHPFENMANGYKLVFLSSDKANVYGFDLLIGYQITKPQSIFYLETFTSIGYRKRIRDYTILVSMNQGGANSFPNYPAPNSTRSYHVDQDYPMVTIGLKLGLNTFFK